MTNTDYFIQRTLQAILTFVSVTVLTFLLFRVMPGNPIDAYRAKLIRSGQYSPEEVERIIAIRTNISPDKPLYEQFLDYFTGLVTGDLGQSIRTGQDVAGMLADAMPWTIFVSAVSLLFIFAIGILLGAAMAYVESSDFDVASSVFSIIVTSIPYYVLAVILVWFLGYQANMFPTGGRVNYELTPGINLPFIKSVLYHGALPIASLVIARFGQRALAMRGNSIQVLGSDYLRVARLRGLSEQRIVTRYVARNAILPMYTSIMIAIGSLFGNSIILEKIFGYPGMGLLIFNSLNSDDYTVLMGGFIFITFGTLLGVYIADLTYGLVDPRASSSGNTSSQGVSIRTLFVRLRRFLASLRPGQSVDQPDSFDDRVRAGGPGKLDTSFDDSLFHARADETLSRGDRIRQTIDEYIIATAKIVWHDTRARVGFTITAVFLLTGAVVMVPEWINSLLGTNIVLVEPPKATTDYLVKPFESLEYPLGTNDTGKDILASLIYATPPMLKMVAAGAVFSTGMATLWGTFSGYAGGAIDRAMMSVSDVVMTIPGLPLIIVLAAIIQPENPFVVGIILSVHMWAGFSRALRSQVLTIREESYVESSHTMGVSTPSIVFSDILPNLMPLVMVNFVSTARRVIISSVALYFLGILPFTTLNWGVMMNFAYNAGALYDMRFAHWFLAPMVTIVAFSLGLILLGQGMDRIFNPRIRARHVKHQSSGDENAKTIAADGGSER